MSKQQPATNSTPIVPTFSELPRVQTKGSMIMVKGNLYISDGQEWIVSTASGRTLVDSENWTTFLTTGPTAKWTAFDPTRMDATVTNTTGSITLNQTPQSFSLVPEGSTLDHINYLVYRKGPDPKNSNFAGAVPGALGAYRLPDTGEFYVEATVSARQFLPPGSAFAGPVAAQIDNPKADARIGAASLAFLDEQTGCVFDIFITETVIYALVERLPFARPSFGGGLLTEYAAYTAMFPIAQRGGNQDPLYNVDTLDEYTKVAFAINKEKGYARYLVNDVEKLRVSDFGIAPAPETRVLDEGGIPSVQIINQLQVGFGIFLLSDASSPTTVSNTEGLVRLNPPPALYYNPRTVDATTGQKVAQTFASTTLSEIYSSPDAQGMSFRILPLGIYYQQVTNEQ
ncbi:hypothetical protein ISTM_373 [Insectomime virus]|uniref:Uncharacterized protein n=1 Tax=Tunisvirus fontaine2 TaxID=1421067 RepID=V9SEJ6_9VIRU|nr:hypothetical protein D1R32_gp428 [Tunisvirus fontaine2]AHA46271.1 hypothetical protein ISTM_373 [Insectomime virus]AHC55145.1 hypothetical protein TNS_ORF427 [Tunisvirus fontaine2]